MLALWRMKLCDGPRAPYLVAGNERWGQSVVSGLGDKSMLMLYK